jgi:hypothetical protein
MLILPVDKDQQSTHEKEDVREPQHEGMELFFEK